MRAAVVGVLVLVLPQSVTAQGHTAGSIVIDRPWSRQTPSGAKVAGAYLTVTNTGTEADRLVGGSAKVAGGFEIHASRIENGIARMRKVEDGVMIAPGETVTLAPMGTHVMLTGLTTPVVAGQQIRSTLVFEKAGEVDVSFAVAPIGGQAPPPAEGEHAGHGR